MKRTYLDHKKVTAAVLIAVLVAVLLTVAFILLRNWEERQGEFPSHETEDTVLDYQGVEYVPREGIETFLVLGLDKNLGESSSDSYNNDMQADFIMLFVFDNTAKRCSAIHINRDTMANVNLLALNGNKITSVRRQIALAYNEGNGENVSCRNTADAVSDLLLGVKVNHYLSVTMDAVPVYNDLLGGVEVTVLDDFTGVDDTLVKGETVTLMGEQALRYVRTRYGLEDSTNNTRMARQQQYINALYAKAKEKTEEDEEFLVTSAVKMSEYIISDRSVTQLQELARKLEEYAFAPIYDIDGESVLGKEFVEFYPDADAVQRIVVELFYEPKTP